VTDKLTISKISEVYVKIHCEKWMAQELTDYFQFKVENAHFIPAVKNGYWDGYIRLFNYGNQNIYYGLVPYIEKFAADRDYEITYEGLQGNAEFSASEAVDFVNSLRLAKIPRDYQYKAFVDCVRERRQLLLSPTASGKSLIIYLLLRYYDKKALVIVPTTSLVHQMSTDFLEYSKGEYETHLIMAGKDKDAPQQTYITTWQSAYKMPKAYFDQFDVVIGDEAHLFKAKSLTSILEKMTDVTNRFGLTGTLDGSETHKLVLEGLFGRVNKVISTKELIDQGHIAELKIKAIVLQYPDALKAENKKHKYQEEMDFLTSYEPRNRFLRNLALSLKGNTLLLFQFVEKHGKILFDDIQAHTAKGRKVFFVHGGTDAETRESIRAITEMESDAIIVASYGTFSTGINIVNLHNLILASPSKSRIRNLQSLGRSLRRSDTKTQAVLFDIADDLSYKTKRNYTLNHFLERIKIYSSEKLSYRLYKVELNERSDRSNSLF
jgi:superfamily II DNA or RNA helicase